MSGGSYNYLYSADADEIAERREDLESMIDSLRGRGFVDAANETYGILLDWQAFQFRTQAKIARLKDVWQSVEWHDSNDSGPEGVDEAIAAYRGLDFGLLPEGHRMIVQGACECGQYVNRCAARVTWEAERHAALVAP